jgi:hypothetical protein
MKMARLHSQRQGKSSGTTGARVQHKPLRYIKLYICRVITWGDNFNPSFPLSGSASCLASHIINAVFFLRFPCKSFLKILTVTSFVGLLFTGKGVYGFLTGRQGQALRVLRKISTPALRSG